jgi:hypothetical protein
LTTRPGKIERTIADIARLRTVMHRAQRDAERASKGHKFIYLVDPAVLELWFTPKKWAHQVSAIPSRHRQIKEEHRGKVVSRSTAEDDPTLVTTAYLTGEHIFSTNLVGENGALYVSPEHMDEFGGFVAKVERAARREAKRSEAANRRSAEDGAGLYDELLHQLQGQLAAYNRGAIPPELWVERFRGIVAQSLANVASHDDILAAHKLQAIISRDILAHATNLIEFTREIIAPDEDAIEDWKTAILEAKADNDQQPSADAIEADAVTLEQVYLLNRQAAPSTTYLLITSDEGCHSAYEAKVEKAGAAGEHVRFALRYPIEFSPILSMETHGAEAELANRISRYVDLIAAADSIERSGTNGRPKRTDASAALVALVINAEREVAEGWHLLLNFACSAKGNMIFETARSENRFWLDFVRSNDFISAFSDATRSFGKQVVRAAETKVLLRQEYQTLDHMSRRSNEDEQSPDDFSRRSIPTVFRDFSSDGLRGRSLPEHLDRMKKHRSGALDLLQSISDRNERLLLVSALALEIGAWTGAMALLKEIRLPAQRVDQPFGASPLHSEISYFRCLAWRLSAREDQWQTSYASAHATLSRLTEAGVLDRFGQARARSEHAALHLCLVAWRYEPARPAEAELALQQAVSHLRFAMEAVSRLAGTPEELGFWTLRRQIALNIYCTATWTAILMPRSLQGLAKMIDEADVTLKTLPSGMFRPGPHQQIYPQLARLALEEFRDRNASLAIVDDIATILSKNRDSRFAYDLPPVDRVEFEKIIRWLGQLHEQG